VEAGREADADVNRVVGSGGGGKGYDGMVLLDQDCGNRGAAGRSGRELRAASATGISHTDRCADVNADGDTEAEADGHAVAHFGAHRHAGADPSPDSDCYDCADRGDRQSELYYRLR